MFSISTHLKHKAQYYFKGEGRQRKDKELYVDVHSNSNDDDKLCE